MIEPKEIKSAIAMDASYNCAQSLILPFLEQYGVREEDGIKIASAFGSGMGRMQETCGAVTGAFMVLGLEYGFVHPKDQRQRQTLLVKTSEFVAKFKNEYGTIKCRDLLMCDLNTEEGQKKHKEENQRELVCKKCIKYSAKILEEMIGK
ncbi:MAG: C_GCAxxG_C_C family protein [Ignavibacteriales bacterium]|nr:C_GCAxxG_C_C family protein [Bacteroidota bacterium]MBI3579739.1 C_GCAxxG_C_C family protein [Ignavibacteriales bacterium]MBI3788189.1 C_GCAxxG_C_C family protein [Ignavibacteriales bacterium]